MKILVLSFYYYPDLCAGSFRAEAFVKALLEDLPEGASVELITTQPNRYKSFSKDAAAYETIGNLTIRRIKLPSHNSGIIDQVAAFTTYAFQALRLVRNKEYQAVYSTSSRLMTASLGAFIARKKKAFLYLDIRDIFVDTIGDIFSKKISFFAKPFFSLIERFTINRADSINLVSEGFKEYFENKYPKKSYSYFTNGIDEAFLNINYEKKSTNNDIINVLYAGNIGEGQGLHLIIPQLSERLKNKVHFRIIGDGGRKQALKNALNEKACGDMVKYLPPLGRKELIEEYRQADVLFLHLSNHQAFEKVLPSKVFEYAATGKPIWAGLSGFSAQFVSARIINSAVFASCNLEEALESFLTLKLEHSNRSSFVEEFSRDKIMKKVSKDFFLRLKIHNERA